MGRVEKMLLNFCRGDWSSADSLTRGRLIEKSFASENWKPMSSPASPSVWRCFFARHQQEMRECATWSRSVAQLLAKFDAESASAAIEGVLNGSR
jgi:hypothetical protein